MRAPIGCGEPGEPGAPARGWRPPRRARALSADSASRPGKEARAGQGAGVRAAPKQPEARRGGTGWSSVPGTTELPHQPSWVVWKKGSLPVGCLDVAAST